ncbi:MAG TPA: cytochrome C oxidase subunit IV family protein [Thermomicrobiaceae bacterium]|nr:cytochrome C oxidase subunit IV family protein [Thermomicrobiaceae bacterium]
MTSTTHETTAIEPGHPGAAAYVKIAVILSILTMTEVAIWYIPAFAVILTPALILLSIAKFTLVVMFYMHLKFDSRFFSGVFLWGLFIAISILLSMMAIYTAF